MTFRNCKFLKLAQSTVFTCPTCTDVVFRFKTMQRCWRQHSLPPSFLVKCFFEINVFHRADLIWFCVALLEGAISKVQHLNKNRALCLSHSLPSTDYFHIYYLIFISIHTMSPRSRHCHLLHYKKSLIHEFKENIRNMPRASELIRAKLVFHPSLSDLRSSSPSTPPLPS